MHPISTSNAGDKILWSSPNCQRHPRRKKSLGGGDHVSDERFKGLPTRLSWCLFVNIAVRRTFQTVYFYGNRQQRWRWRRAVCLLCGVTGSWRDVDKNEIDANQVRLSQWGTATTWKTIKSMVTRWTWSAVTSAWVHIVVTCLRQKIGEFIPVTALSHCMFRANLTFSRSGKEKLAKSIWSSNKVLFIWRLHGRATGSLDGSTV